MSNILVKMTLIKRGEKSEVKKILLIIGASILGMLAIIFLILFSFIHVDLKDLNGGGDLFRTVLSPSKLYKAELYKINEGGATVGQQERVSITYIAGNGKAYDDETIYWIYPSPSAGTDFIWLSDDMIEVNGKVIDIHDKKTYYNWKKDDDL